MRRGGAAQVPPPRQRTQGARALSDRYSPGWVGRAGAVRRPRGGSRRRWAKEARGGIFPAASAVWLGGRGEWASRSFFSALFLPGSREGAVPGVGGEKLEWEVSGPLGGRGAAPDPDPPLPAPRGGGEPRDPRLHSPAFPGYWGRPGGGGGLRSSLCEVASAGRPAVAPRVCQLLSSFLFPSLGLQMTL